MGDKRRDVRTELGSTILLKRLGSNDVEQEVAISVTDVSKSGIGFTCETPLEIGTVYESYLTIWTKEVLHTFIEIIRIEKSANIFTYGGIFIGMPEMDAARIEVYQTVESKKE